MARTVPRQYILAGVLILLLVVSMFLLRAVIKTAFFAITVAYVLYPVREVLLDRGLSRRITAAAISVGAFSVVLASLGVAGVALYRRRAAIVTVLRDLPEELVISVGGFTYREPTATFVGPVIDLLRSVAVSVAQSAPVLVLKLLLFAILLFGLLLRPGAVGQAVFHVVPAEYHDVVQRFHNRTRDTLYGIYVLQVATAAGTFVVALITFAALGYPAFVTLAAIAAVLQFIPVVGPGVLLALLAIADVFAGDVTRALLVIVVGGIVIGLLPDAIIRPRLASYAADLPVSLYFVGFVGGVLSLGAVGFIAGPLVVGLVVEAVALLSAEELTR